MKNNERSGYYYGEGVSDIKALVPNELTIELVKNFCKTCFFLRIKCESIGFGLSLSHEMSLGWEVGDAGRWGRGSRQSSVCRVSRRPTDPAQVAGGFLLFTSKACLSPKNLLPLSTLHS